MDVCETYRSFESATAAHTRLPVYSRRMARVAVVGPGSVGLFFAGHLAAAGHDVVSCARRPFDRYIIESETFPLDLEATVLTDPADVTTTVDWVLFAVKAHQTEGASGWLQALCDENTRVLIVQNGIEHDCADAYTNGAPTIPTVVYCGAGLIEPGRIRHTSSGHLIVPSAPYGEDMLTLFADSHAEVRPSENFTTHKWRKLSLNVMANGLTALTGRKMGVLGDPTIRPIAVELIRECWQVAREDGADLDPDNADELVTGVLALGRDEGTSMYFDTVAGRPTEHDAIHGAALRKAEAFGIDTPTIRLIHGLLDARSRGLNELPRIGA